MLWRWRLGLLLATLVGLGVSTACMVSFWITRQPPVWTGQAALLASQLPLIANLFLTDPWVSLWRKLFKTRRRK